MSVYRDIYPYFNEIISQCDELKNTTNITDHIACPDSQIALQTNDIESDDWSAGIGKAKGDHIWEQSFNKIHPKIKGTAIDDYIQWLGVPVYRARLMLTKPKFVYSIHKDYSPRLHLPIVTNPQCFFVFKDPAEFIHMPADGRTYFTNTKKQHTFMNGSTHDRLHIVMVIKE